MTDTSNWGPADWSVIAEGVGSVILLVIVLAIALGESDIWYDLSEPWRKNPQTPDPANRLPYKSPALKLAEDYSQGPHCRYCGSRTGSDAVYCDWWCGNAHAGQQAKTSDSKLSVPSVPPVKPGFYSVISKLAEPIVEVPTDESWREIKEPGHYKRGVNGWERCDEWEAQVTVRAKPAATWNPDNKPERNIATRTMHHRERREAQYGPDRNEGT